MSYSVSSEGSVSESINASSKPWHLTYNLEFKELFIWKNGIRMKLKDGNSGGPVTSVSILSIVDKTVTVSCNVLVRGVCRLDITYT